MLNRIISLESTNDSFLSSGEQAAEGNSDEVKRIKSRLNSEEGIAYYENYLGQAAKNQ